MKNWLKENWMVILGIGFVVVYFVVLNNIVSSDTAKAWFSKPATSITVGDIFIIALIHAFINRSDKK